MSKKKIIQVITRLDRGGSADIVLHLSAELHALGHEVCLISGKTAEPTENLELFEKQSGVTVHFLPSLVRDICPMSDLTALWQLFLIFRRQKPDVVHLHSSKAGFLGRVAAFFAGVPRILYSTHGHIFYGYFSPLKTKIFIMMEKFGGYCGDVLITLTEQEKKDFISLHILDEKKIEVVANGLDLTPYQKNREQAYRSFRGEHHLAEDTLVIGWIGRFEQVKRPDLFIRVMASLKKVCRKRGGQLNLSGVMVGDGSMKEKTEEMIKEEGVQEDILLTGYLNSTVAVTQSIDILCLTSENEGFGMVVLEAMAAGKPVVSFDVGGVKDLIVEGETGFLIPFDDVEKMAETLLLLSEDKKLMYKMGEKGQAEAEKYTLSAMVQNLELLYDKIP